MVAPLKSSDVFVSTRLGILVLAQGGVPAGAEDYSWGQTRGGFLQVHMEGFGHPSQFNPTPYNFSRIEDVESHLLFKTNTGAQLLWTGRPSGRPRCPGTGTALPPGIGSSSGIGPTQLDEPTPCPTGSQGRGGGLARAIDVGPLALDEVPAGLETLRRWDA